MFLEVSGSFVFQIVEFDFWVAGSLVVEFPVVDSDFSVAGFFAVEIPAVEILAAGSFVADLFFCTTVFLELFACCIVSALSLSAQVCDTSLPVLNYPFHPVYLVLMLHL